MSCSTRLSDWDHLHKIVYCKDAACTYPEGECSGKCALLHRVDTSHLPDDRAAIVAGSHEQRPPRQNDTNDLPADSIGTEPLRIMEIAAGCVAGLLAVLAIVAFNADRFFN